MFNRRELFYTYTVLNLSFPLGSSRSICIFFTNTVFFLILSSHSKSMPDNLYIYFFQANIIYQYLHMNSTSVGSKEEIPESL